MHQKLSNYFSSLGTKGELQKSLRRGALGSMDSPTMPPLLTTTMTLPYHQTNKHHHQHYNQPTTPPNSSPNSEMDDSLQPETFKDLELMAMILRTDIENRNHAIHQLESLTHALHDMNGSSTTTVSSLAPPPSNLSPMNRSTTPPPDAMSRSPSYNNSAAGKSGRVIEKLMAENDRLRRELKVETTAREEERKAKEAIRQHRDLLQSTNDNLVMQNNIDRTALSRKDRKIEELKQQKEVEARMREAAEGDLRVTQRETNEIVQEVKSQLSREVMERKKAVNEYDVLKESIKRIDAGYSARLEKMKAQVDALEKQRHKDADTLQKLEVTIEQQQQELEKMRAAKTKITEKYSETLRTVEEEMAAIRNMASDREQELIDTIETAKTTLGSLRHSLKVQNNFKDD